MQAARKICIKDILVLAAWVGKKLKGNNNTKDKYVKASKTWDFKMPLKKHTNKTKHQQKKIFMQ